MAATPLGPEQEVISRERGRGLSAGGAGPHPDGFSAARSLFLVREAGRPVRGVRFSGGCFLTARGEGWRAFGGETEESAAGEFERPGGVL